MLKALWQQLLNLLPFHRSDTTPVQACGNAAEQTNFSPPEPMEMRIRFVNVEPLTSLHEGNQLLIALEKILAKQDADAEMRSKRSGYEITGKWVRDAAWDARTAVRQNLEQTLATNSLEPILSAVARAKGRFADFYDDEDGFGSGTFNEIISDLECLQTELTGQTKSI